MTLADQLPDPKSFGSVGWIIVSVVGVIGLLGIVVATVSGSLALMDRIKGKPKSEPHELKQPVQIEHVERFVTVQNFNQAISEKFEQVGRRFLGIEQQIKEQVLKTDTYIHEMRHEMRNQLNALSLASDERNQALATKLDTHLQQLNQDRRVGVARLHDKVEASHTAIRTEIDEKVKEIRGEIGQLPTRLIALLKDTGAIGGKGGRA